jgi:Beta protein
VPRIDFLQFDYYPTLQASLGEHMGYRELSEESKAALLPVFELSQRGMAPDLNQAMADVRDSAGAAPFILDLCKDAFPPPFKAQNPRDAEADRVRFEREEAVQTTYNAALETLLNPTDGFAAWRRVAAVFRNAIPALQFTDAAVQSRQILRQAALSAAGGKSIAIRITSETDRQILQTIAEIYSILESPSQLLVILDCGQGRQQLSLRAQFAVDTLSQLLNILDVSERPLVHAVCMSNSFTSPQKDGFFEYENFDWRIWDEARESFPFMFGDYAATHRRLRKSTFVPPDRRATVICPLSEMWLCYRDPNANDPDGLIEGSKEIVGRAEFTRVPECWGKDLITRAARGDLGGHDAARFWYAAKVNIHLTTQAQYARVKAFEDDSDD